MAFLTFILLMKPQKKLYRSLQTKEWINKRDLSEVSVVLPPCALFSFEQVWGDPGPDLVSHDLTAVKTMT